VVSVHLRRLENRLARTGARLIAQATRDGVPLTELPSIRLPWYEVRNADGTGGDGGAATVFIYDEIGGSMGIQAAELVEELEAITAPVIRVRINSPGGALFDGIAICNALRHHTSRVVVYVDSLAASAASVIAMGGDEIVMMPGSQLMIHDASVTFEGDTTAMRKLITWLDRQSDNVAGIYQRRGGGEVAEWRALMLAETWMFADEAVEMGLADRVDEPVERRPADQGPDERMMRAHDLTPFRYAGRRAAPAPSRQSQQRTRERVVATVQNRSAVSVTAAAGPVVSDQIRLAASRRKEAAESGGEEGQQLRSTPPNGAGWRRVCTKWMADRMPAGQRPPSLTATLTERDGKQFYVVEGYFTIYERGYEMWDEYGPYVEMVSAGAGAATVKASPDTIFVINHTGLAMARTNSSNTLELWSDNYGGGNRAWLNPNRDDVQLLRHGIEDGIITEQSFRFMITAGRWSPDYTEYRIDEFDLDRGDTSAVNFGANPYTDIAGRSREILDELDQLPAGAARAALDRLNRRADLAQMTRTATILHSGPAERPLTGLQMLAAELDGADTSPLGSVPSGANDVLFLESMLALAEADMGAGAL
jgi:ATP-dependent protease ClpP protease subunit/phage head maturation protease